VVVAIRCATGEGPLWSPEEGCLYWVDIPRGRLYRHRPDAGHELLLQSEVIGGFTLQADGGLLLFQGQGRVRLWRDGALTTVVEGLADEAETRFNDVIADPAGRVFCGTMPGERTPARLYRLDPDGSIERVLDNLGQANGMGFSPAGDAFYFTDTKAGTITRFAYDADSGALRDPEIFARLGGEYPVMDGLTVDAEGCVWSARFGGGCVVRLDEGGNELERIELPTERVTSAAFGGADRRDLYITTAGGDETTPEEDLHAGDLFLARLSVAGRPEFRSRVLL